MISQRSARIAGVTLGLCVGVACRDAPTEPIPIAANVQPAASIVIDSVDQFPPEPQILNPYTHIGYAEQGGRYLLELRVGMEYIGNKASMSTDYSIAGDGVSQHDKIYNEQDAFYTASLSAWKRFDQVYYIEVPRSCGLAFEAYTHHQAWWWLYLRLMPDWKSPRRTAGSSATPYLLQPCEEDQPPEEVEGETERINTTTTTSGGGGSITVESCWYWANYENGRLVSIELDHCDVWVYPVDPTMGPMEM